MVEDYEDRSKETMKIFHIPCLEDNYSYLIIDESTGEAAVVDPVEPEKVIASAEQHRAKIKFVLTTHHHCVHFFILGESEGVDLIILGESEAISKFNFIKPTQDIRRSKAVKVMNVKSKRKCAVFHIKD